MMKRKFQFNSEIVETNKDLRVLVEREYHQRFLE
jgi:hypothetical protein